MTAAAALAAVLLVLAVLAVPGRSSGRRGGRLAVRRGSADEVVPRARAGLRRPVRATPGPVLDVPLLLELTAAAVTAGLPPGTAVEEALAAVESTRPGPLADPSAVALQGVCAQLRLGADPRTAWAGAGPDLAPLADALLLSALAGAPAADLLLSAAGQARRERRRAAQEAAARLGSLLVLPLGLCTLPSFLLLGVVPVVLTLAGSLLTG
ncbi:type II secretion system F family protein [Kineococcus rubinsiae]|uniref:type II secretion system F family protein n=1 Tax=Kineococcus rubinsiae TaxID=2609562 RepID=UPI00142FC232|nr:type II secretion system F family protein [Kineococcus rubinsiae]